MSQKTATTKAAAKRKPPKRKRSVLLQVYLSETEEKLLSKLTRRRGTTPSGLVRHWIERSTYLHAQHLRRTKASAAESAEHDDPRQIVIAEARR